MTQAVPGNKPTLTVAVLGALVAVAGWTFWPTLAELSHKWFHDPQYSHGILVPFFAAYLLWARREQHRGSTSPELLAGFGCLLVAGACRVASGMFVFTWVDAIAVLPCLLGLALLAGGWAALRWSWPAIAFLFFMIPLLLVISFMAFVSNTSTTPGSPMAT